MIRLIPSSEVDECVSMPDAIAAVATAHRRLAARTAAAPAPSSVAAPGSDAQFLGMSAVDSVSGLASMKFLADIPANRERALPTQRSMIMVSSLHGAPLALIDGGAVTRIRTAAASAVATDALARPDARVLGLIGAGVLAEAHLEAISLVRSLTRVVIWSRTAERAGSLAAVLSQRGIPTTVVGSARDAVEQSDIVCTLTPSREPVLEGAWLRPGQHVNAVGAPPRADHREVDSEAVRRARVILDTRSAALAESGDVLIPLREGSIDEAHLGPELGEVLLGITPGRRHLDEITLFNSLGSGLQDLALASLLVSAHPAAEPRGTAA
ncbi:ornithine cyclodeaminase family protein [Agromyces tropicus]|uniref:Ornithine cyclodeaminase family protein n=1 Tax=Agromyces tropicus TaxID=555371 RepID=A0ABP5FLU9_9MICO